MALTKNLRDGILKIADNSGQAGANKITVALDEGDLRFTETKGYIQVSDRGVLDHVRPGDQVAVTLSFGCKFVGFQVDSNAISVYEALTMTGGASAWVSANGATSDVYATELTFEIYDADITPAVMDTLVFDKFHMESIEFSEGADNNTLAVSGFAFITAPSIG